ncbi:MAG: 2-octaprenyl-6-methoxyphenyl hydroxylase [Cellvibrionaceae bacterium]
MKTDIVIIGGGMVGICLAILLARKKPSWSVTLIESFPLAQNNDSSSLNSKNHQPSFDSRSTALAAGSKDILEQCGLWKTLKAHATPITKVHVSDKNHFGGAVIDAADYAMDAVGYVVENAWFGQVLKEELFRYDSIHIVAPASVKTVKPKKNGYDIEVQIQNSQCEQKDLIGASSQCISAELTIVADGANSAIAQQLGIQITEKNYHQQALVANIQCDKPHHGIAYERFTDQGPIALLPLNSVDKHSKTMALVWTLPEKNQTLLKCDDSFFLKTLQERFGFRQGYFLRVSRRIQHPLKLQLAKEQVRRSLVLMGNAAHFLHPVAGQGFNLALRDCDSLSTILSTAVDKKQSIGDLHILQQYVDNQKMDQLATVSLSDNFVEWFSSASSTKSVLRNMGLFALDAVPGAASILGKRTMGLQ